MTVVSLSSKQDLLSFVQHCVNAITTTVVRSYYGYPCMSVSARALSYVECIVSIGQKTYTCFEFLLLVDVTSDN